MNYLKSKGRALLDNGYLIIPIKHGSKAPAMQSWQTARLTENDLAKYGNAGIGVLCGQGDYPVIGIDIDTTNAELALKFTDWCIESLGFTCERVGAAPKILLPYMAAEAGWKKATSAWFESADGIKHRLEMLGDGQQFVSHHIHPDTGRPYEWTDILGGIEYFAADALPEVTKAQVNEAIRVFEEMALDVGLVKVESGSALSDGQSFKDNSPVGLSLEQSAQVLTHSDNNDYDTWVRVGMALHHEYSGDSANLSAAFNLWDDWSKSASSYKGFDDLNRRWAKFGKGGGSNPVTMRSLMKGLQITTVATADEFDIVEVVQKPEWKITLDAHVGKWNETHASVMIGGENRIMRFEPGSSTHNGREIFSFYNRDELSRVHDNRIIKTGESVQASGKVKDIYKNELMAWALHPQSNSFTGGVVFLPGKLAPADYFNTWRGFNIEPKQNDALLERLHFHMKQVICAGHDDLYTYLLNWIAYSIKYPDKPAGAAIVTRGEKGSGKGTLGHFLKNIWGNHGLHISNVKHLVGNFNGHLNDVCFLFADEAFFSGDKQHEGVLKALVTEPTIMVERKGIDAVPQPNYLKIFMATNSDFAVPASKDERRYCVLDTANTYIGDRCVF